MTPTIPATCDECPVIGDACYDCTWPQERIAIRMRPRCEFCGETAVRGIVSPYRVEGEGGITHIGFMNIPVCGSQDCQDEAERLREII